MDLQNSEPFSFTVERVEKELSIPSGFFSALREEDDWSFVIKAHAFVEAALTNILIRHLERPELEEILSRLSTSNTVTGKIAFGRKMGLLADEDYHFIRELSSLRNRLAHGLDEIDFNFDKFVSGLEPSRCRSFARTISFIPKGLMN